MKPAQTPHSFLVRVVAGAVIAAIGLAVCGHGPTAAAERKPEAAPPPAAIDLSALLSADRATTWNPGMMGVGGIPVRSTVCATLTPGGGTQDDTARIQAAINACPAGQVVQLAAGTFLINSGNYLLINKGITLRGAGPDRTTLAKTDGAKPFNSAVGAQPSPLIVVGTSLFSSTGNTIDVAGSTNLTADAVKGAYTVTVANAAGLSPGQIVLLDEASGAGWRDRPAGARTNLGRARLAGGLAEAQSRRSLRRRFRAGGVSDHAQFRRLLVLPAGPPHRRGQADRLRLRVHHHLHHARFTSPTGPATPRSCPATAGRMSKMPASRT